MKKNTRSLIKGLVQGLSILALLAAVGCEAPVGSLPSGDIASKAAAATTTAWAVGVSYTAGQVVSYNGNLYTCLQPNTAIAGWDPVSVPALWKASGTAPATTPTPAATPVPSATPKATPTPTPVPSATPKATPTPTPVTSPVPSPSPVPPGSATTGTVNFHLLIGTGGAPQDKIVLDGDNYTDLIESNYVAGAMYGYLIGKYYPGEQFNKDYLYGSIMGQLLQENLSTESYVSSSSLIDSDTNQQSVMGAGQGGPYQINAYAYDMDSPYGRTLCNFVAVQKNIGYTLAQASTMNASVTPPAFNNKYFGPVLCAYFHFNDYVCLNIIGKGTGGWTTPWEPSYDNALANFKTLPNNFLDMILNAAYNQGYYGPYGDAANQIVVNDCKLGATATAADVTAINQYSKVWGSTNTYQQYPYQIHYYLDQLYNNPIPTTSATTFTTTNNHVIFTMAGLANVFSNVYQTLAYKNASGTYGYITAAQASAAFTAGLTKASVAANASLDLGNSAQRAQIFAVLDAAIASLETTLGTDFTATTQTQL